MAQGDESHSSDENECDFILYEDREDWQDVTPIYLHEAETQLVNIIYSPRFKSSFAYFRAVMEKQEMSERALLLTQECIDLNAANYTVWYYRRLLLEHLCKDLREELRYLDSITRENQKNYQVWQHRKCLVEKLGDPSAEKQFTLRLISIDSKNYHAWQHRQWVIKAFSLYDGELQYSSELLAQDVRNNSAWNHRYFVLKNNDQLQDPDILSSEIQFTFSKILLAPNNESPWNYLRALIQLEALRDDDCQKVHQFVDQKFKDGCKSPHLLSFKLEMLKEQLDKQANQETLNQALDLCNDLMDKHDCIRKNYWQYVASSITSKYSDKISKN